MSLITDVWQQLVQRRLWPVAVLLLGALVAVPVLLHKDPAPAPAAPVTLPQTGAKDGATAKPVVALADGVNPLHRHVLGAAKDPFAPAPAPRARRSGSGTATASGASSSGSGTPASAGGGGFTPEPVVTSTGGGASYSGGTPSGGTSLGGSPSGGSSLGGSPASPVTPSPAPTPAKPEPKPAPKPQFPANSLTVRFGSGEGDLAETTLEPLAALPADASDGDTPVLVYLGLVKGGREATFLLDDSVTAQGDGRCETDGGTACDTLHLRAGETEFLDVTDDTGAVTRSYELDLVKIHAKSATGARASRAVRASHASRHRARLGGRPLARRVARAFASQAPAAHAAGARMAHVVAVLEPGM